MAEITVRELRNQGREVLERVSRGEVLAVTRDGIPVAELRPLPRHPHSAESLLERWRRLPSIDPVRWRSDIDDVLDSSL